MSWLKDLAKLDIGLVTEDTGWTTTDVSSWAAFSSRPAAGINVDQTSAMNCATVYACTEARVSTLSSMPAIIYDETDKANRTKAMDTMFWGLLHDQPNPDMDSMQFYELVSARSINRGNGYAWIVRNNRDQPIELWPIHNSRVMPMWNHGSLEYHVYLDKKNPSNPYGFEYFTVGARDMFNLVGFNSQNGITANGVIPYAKEDISLDQASQQYGATWFGNGARPGGLVKHPSYIKQKDKRDEFRRDINAIHGGRENWNKVGVLWEGAEWQNVEVSPEQAQFLGTRGVQGKVICRWYKTPPAVVQIFDDYKFSTVDAMLRQFVMLCLRTDAERWERAIRRQIFYTNTGEAGPRKIYPDKELIFEFLMDSLLRGDPETQAKTDEMLLRWGVVNIDEARRVRNMDPLSNGQGQNHFFPMNYAPLSQILDGSARSNTSTGFSGDRAQAMIPTKDGKPKFEKAIYKAVRDAAKIQATATEQLGSVIEGRISEVSDQIDDRLEGAVLTGSEHTQRICQTVDRTTELHRDAIDAAMDQQTSTLDAQWRPAIRDGYDQTEVLGAQVAAVSDERRQYARNVLSEATARMIAVESNAMRRASTKTSDFLSRVDRFYDKHASVMCDAIAIGVDGVLKSLGFPVKADTSLFAEKLARDHCEQSRGEMLDAADGDPDEFKTRVGNVIGSWESRSLDVESFLHQEPCNV